MDTPACASNTVKKKRVLLLDDDKQILDMYALILPQLLPDYSFMITDNGVEALASFKLCPYDVIVSDIDMDHMNGDTLFKEIRKVCQNAMPRFIFCSGVNAALMAAGAISTEDPIELILKPFDLSHLAERISR